MKYIFYLSIFTILLGCAKLPIQTIALSDAIIVEGERMHELNITLVNRMFSDKREIIDNFIKNEYVQKYIKDFSATIPVGTDYKKELPQMMESIIPVIISRRDIMQRTLESQRIKLLAKINADYLAFQEASTTLTSILHSVADVDKEWKSTIRRIKDVSQGQIDLDQIEKEINNFIIKAGDINENVIDFDDTINAILKN